MNIRYELTLDTNVITGIPGPGNIPLTTMELQEHKLDQVQNQNLTKVNYLRSKPSGAMTLLPIVRSKCRVTAQTVGESDKPRVNIEARRAMSQRIPRFIDTGENAGNPSTFYTFYMEPIHEQITLPRHRNMELEQTVGDHAYAWDIRVNFGCDSRSNRSQPSGSALSPGGAVPRQGREGCPSSWYVSCGVVSMIGEHKIFPRTRGEERRLRASW